MNAKIIAALAVFALAFVGLAFADDQADATDPALIPAATEYSVSNLTTSGTITIGVLEAPTETLTITATSTDTTIATVTGEASIEAPATSADFTVTFAGVGTTTITFTATGYTDAVVNITAGNVEVVPTYSRLAVNATATSIPISTLFGEAEILTCTSSNPGLIPNPSDVPLTDGAGTISVTPVEGAVGSAEITFASSGTTVPGSVMVYVGSAVMGYMNDKADAADTSFLQAIVYSDATVYMDASNLDLRNVPDVYFTVVFDEDGAGAEAAEVVTLVTGPISAQNRMSIDIPGYILFDGTATTQITMNNYTTRTPIATFDAVAFSEPLEINMDKNSDRDAFKADGTTAFVDSYPAGEATYIAKGANIDTTIVIPGFTFLGWGATDNATVYFDLTIGEGDAAPTIEEYLFATNGNFIEEHEDFGDAYVIYAIWDDTVSVEVLYVYDAAPVADLNGTVYIYTDNTKGAAVAFVHDVPSVAQVGDNLLLRIQQTAAGNYTYDVGVYSSYTWNADSEEVESVEIEGAARMITNGVWVIDEIPSNIYIVVTATEAGEDAPITGYHFFIDSVETTTASMSWDAVDYVPAGAISFDGTYYRTDATLGNVYGSFALLQNPTYALIVDNVAQTDADAAVVLSEDLGYNYDYSITMANGFSIYAAQGIWAIPNADPEEDPTLVYTPWSLVAQA